MTLQSYKSTLLQTNRFLQQNPEYHLHPLLVNHHLIQIQIYQLAYLRQLTRIEQRSRLSVMIPDILFGHIALRQICQSVKSPYAYTQKIQYHTLTATHRDLLLSPLAVNEVGLSPTCFIQLCWTRCTRAKSF